MLNQFFTRSGIVNFLRRVRSRGFTPTALLRRNRNNTRQQLKDAFAVAVNSDHESARFAEDLNSIVRRRKISTLVTLRGLMSSVRGQARAVLATGKRGRWHNVSVLDGRTSTICIGYIGQSWDGPYSDIPDKPPRHPNCRSFLRFVEDGDPIPDERPFIEQFNESEEVQLDLLGAKRFEAFKNGDLPINSVAQFERAVLNTLEDLGL